MQVSGGDLREITFNFPSFSGRILSKSGEAHTLDLGGLKTDDSDQNIDTGGNFLNLKSVKPWSYEATIVNAENDPNRLELETMQAASNTFEEGSFTFTCINGIVYTGNGSIVGDIKADRSKATMAFKVMGSGTAQQIS